ncbi:MAG: ABC transporter ATP-binding protein, partial [Bacteroidetes bacterium]
MQKRNPAIAISSLRKRYNSNTEDTLKGIELVINQGEFYGILGPNSAGKTTLISVMCGLLKFNSGRIMIDQQDITSSRNNTKKKIGLVPQEIALYPKLTVKENMAYFGQMHGIFGKDLKDSVDVLLDKLQLYKHADKRISRCSGGIKRRTNIAAGMIHQPKILIL